MINGTRIARKKVKLTLQEAVKILSVAASQLSRYKNAVKNTLLDIFVAMQNSYTCS